MNKHGKHKKQKTFFLSMSLGLEFQKQIFSEIVAEDGLLIVGKGSFYHITFI